MIMRYWQAVAGLSIVSGAILQYFGYHTPVVPIGVIIGGFALAGYIRRLENKGKAYPNREKAHI